jgi:hypothetical protein
LTRCREFTTRSIVVTPCPWWDLVAVHACGSISVMHVARSVDGVYAVILVISAGRERGGGTRDS